MATQRLPATLIQIHYHNRPGGVSRVMDEYAHAFQRIHGNATVRSLVICHATHQNTKADAHASLIDVPAFDYHSFRSASAFRRCRDRLARIIEELLFSTHYPEPICLMGHNLALGKNPALSAAFATVARRHRDTKGVRFISMIHDLAEEGRSVLLSRLHALTSAGIAIRDDLYPPEVRFVVLNPSIRRALRKAGICADLLPNLVPSYGNGRLTKDMRSATIRALGELADRQGLRFDPRRPSVIYPVRVVSRKNILEAVLLAVVGRHANLLLGGPGTAPADRALYDRLVAFCRRHDLTVLLDTGHITPLLNHTTHDSYIPTPLFLPLYRFCDRAISTSVAEGFGYGLYEPWSAGIPVIGRRPVGFEPCGGLRMDQLYDSLPVPADWVDFGDLAARYHHHLRQCLGPAHPPASLPRFRRELRDRFIREGLVDFGVLDLRQQWRILQRVVASGGEVPACTREPFDRQNRLFDAGSRTGKALLAHNSDTLESAMGAAAFDRRLRSCLGDGRVRRAGPFRHDIILRELCGLDRSRLLLTPRT